MWCKAIPLTKTLPPINGVDIPLPTGTRRCRRPPINSMFCHWGIGANVDVVGAVLGCFWGLLEPSWGPLGVPLGALGGFLGARWAFWGSCWVLLGSPCRPLGCSLTLLALSQAGQRVNRTTVDGSTGNGSTESGSVAGSGAQPLSANIFMGSLSPGATQHLLAFRSRKELKTRVNGSTGQRATGQRNRARWPVRGRSPC